jgi:hypothetical protein
MAFSLPYFDVRFVGAILVKARPKRNISATIVADVKRFSRQINTDEVFGTHRGAPRIHGELLKLGFAVAQVLRSRAHYEPWVSATSPLPRARHGRMRLRRG